MTFNSKLNFEPDLERFKNLDRPTHILLSGYLRHSKTFELYKNMFLDLNLDMELVPFELSPQKDPGYKSKLAGLIKEFRNQNMLSSIMVSDPYKQELMQLVDELDESAKLCNSLNMIFKSGKKLVGKNLDGQAFVDGVAHNNAIEFAGSNMFFLGCGGVSSAVSLKLSSLLSKVGLTDVNQKKVDELASFLRKANPLLPVEIYPSNSDRDLSEYQYLYNGTGLGKTSNDPAKVKLSPIRFGDKLASSGVAFDANYSPAQSQFLIDCKARGFKIVNGLSHMLASSSKHISHVSGLDISIGELEDVYLRLFSNSENLGASI